MACTLTQAFHQHFSVVDDPRIDRSKCHLLTDILFLAVCATIAGADGPSDIADFGRQQIQWLRKFITLPNGIPSHDTIGRVFSLIKPLQFQQAFLGWIGTLMPDDVDGNAFRLVPIDGKTLRGSLHRNEEQKPLHLVSAWATNCGLSLGQVAVDEKSNEITAIPKLLEMLELAGAIVTIDAMGCQKDIAEKIVDKKADFVLAVKDNQPNLREAIEASFVEIDNQDSENTGSRHYATKEKSRGRNEERDYVIAPVPKEMLAIKTEWKGLRTIGRVIAKVERDGKQSEEVRYFISSLPPKVKQFAEAVRGHWGIENSLHWVLDVVFGEDASAIHIGHAPENFGFLRRFVVSLLKRDTSEGSLRRKRKRAAWSTSFLEKVLRNR
ncbi:MAG: ISAs1 family transposase [Planctomycetota bacterium]|nr:ISAs1 family transposase [Planctomycetota bacterium]